MAGRTLTLGTLCTGIGLIDLGLERADLGPVKWQCEILPERRAVLQEWWPDVTRYEDVTQLSGADLEWVDVVAFGSPCKNLSSAGDRSGLDGSSSGLFWECLRVVSEVRPRWVVFENVASGASLWVDRVRYALEQLGYETLPIPLAASECGAPHRRGRVFVVAHFDERREHAGAEYAETPSTQALVTDANGASLRVTDGGWGGPQPDMVRVVHGRADRLDGANKRVAALGDSCTPQQAEVIGWIVRILDQSR